MVIINKDNVNCHIIVIYLSFVFPQNPLAFSNTTANPAIKANNFIVYNRATNSFYFKDGKPVTIVSNTFLPKPGVATTVRPNNTTSTPTIVKPKIITSQELSKLISNGQSLLNKDNAPKKIGQGLCLVAVIVSIVTLSSYFIMSSSNTN